MLDKILGITGDEEDEYYQGWHAGGGLVPLRSSSGVVVDEDTALTFGAVFSAVKVISETVSLLPWRPFRESGASRELLANSTLDVLLHRRPNDEMSAFQLREFLISCALLHGSGYCEIERTAIGEPVGLHPIHPSRVEPRRDAAKRLFYRVRNETGEATDLAPVSMFHLRGPTRDGVVGRSVLSLARESWGLGISSELFAAAFFGNGAIPSYFIEQADDAPNLSPEGAENMLRSFERRHRGAKRAGKPALLEHGFTVKAIGIPQKDAQFIETRKLSITDVARWFRVPPHKIADMEKATFSNIEEQERNFVNDAIMPWAMRLEHEANAKLVTEDDVFTKLDVRALLRGTSKDRAEYYTKLRDLGVLDINEIRALEDLNPIDGGDLRLVPANMISLRRAAQSGGTDPASAIRGVVIDAHERILGKEARAVERARSSDKDFSAWSVDFYKRHGEHLCDALMPGANALGTMYGVDADVVAGIVESHASMLCEASLIDTAEGRNVACTPARVKTSTDRLIGRLIGAAA